MIKYSDIMEDLRPGHYYVSMVDGQRFALLTGPFDTHREALDSVSKARDKACEIDGRAHFYSFGTCRMEITANPRRGALDMLKGGV